MRAQKRGGSAKASSRKPVRGNVRPAVARQADGTDQSRRPDGEGAPMRTWRQPAIESPARPRVEINREAGGRIEGSRLTASRPGVAPRRPAAPPAGVVVVRHKRVRTIVKPEDEQ